MKYLGKQVSEPTRELDTIEWDPANGKPPRVELVATEFTHRCPITAQPDFSELRIAYQPRRKLVETKSLKLFLLSFRERREFDERVVNEIAIELWRQVQPESIEVDGRFASRGGISLRAVATLP